MHKLMIAVATYNRKRQTEFCLKQLQRYSYDGDIFIFDDASTEYNEVWLKQFTPNVMRFEKNYGIDIMTAWKFVTFIENDYDFLYITDNDAYVAPTWFTEGKRLLDKYGSPVSLFRSIWHEPFTVEERDDVSIRNVVPGVSILMDRLFVQRYLEAAKRPYNELKSKGLMSPTTGLSFDWFMKEMTYGRCFVSKQSHVEHFGGNGLHSENGYLTDLARDKVFYLAVRTDKLLRYFMENLDEIIDTIPNEE